MTSQRAVGGSIPRLAVLAVLAASAACGTSTVPPASQSAPAGPRLVTLADGHRLSIDCSGSGPVVILDAGLGNEMVVWLQVVALTHDVATVCRYDRAGLGQSEPRPPPHGSVSSVADLHELLGAAGLKPPWVVVGASFGGLNANLFARTYPSEVAGVVLVDAISPRWNAGLEAILSPAQVEERHAIPNGEPITNDELRQSDAAVLGAPAFPPVKLVVLRHGRPFPPVGDAPWPTDDVEALWAKLQAELAAMSPNGVEILAERSGHRIHQDQPGLVSDAIGAILDLARWPPSAAPGSSAAP